MMVANVARNTNAQVKLAKMRGNLHLILANSVAKDHFVAPFGFNLRIVACIDSGA